MSVGRRSLTPHCLGGARSLLALCPRNVCSGRGGNREALPEKAREKKNVFNGSVNAPPSRARTGNTRGACLRHPVSCTRTSPGQLRGVLRAAARVRALSQRTSRPARLSALKFSGFKSCCFFPPPPTRVTDAVGGCRRLSRRRAAVVGERFPAAGGGLFRPMIHLSEVDI